MNEYKVTILGAGLAGCEAALWLAGKGVQVELYEQKPVHFSPAHKSEGFAELICSNSLKAERLDSASGLLKEEMRRMGSRLLTAAEETRVAAGGALAVDRDAFSAAVTRMVEACENITVHREQVETIDESAPILVATGPLTDGALADEIGRLTGDERLHFYDAVAPIVTAESLDYGKVFAASRYDRGEADYLNCPFNKAEYEAFHAALAGVFGSAASSKTIAVSNTQLLAVVCADETLHYREGQPVSAYRLNGTIVYGTEQELGLYPRA